MMVARAHAQPQLDLTHSWVRSMPQAGSGTGAQSYANGVAVLDSATLEHRGTVVVAGHSDTDVMILAAAAPPRGFVAFLSPDQVINPQNWLQHFVGHPSAGAGGAACTGVSVAGPRVPLGRNAFASGWYSGTVSFGDGIIKTTTTGRDAFLARLDRESQSTVWAYTVGGAGHQEALAVSVGPHLWGGIFSAPGDPVRDYSQTIDRWFAAMGGYFTTAIEFVPGTPIASLGGEDAFIGAFDVFTGTGDSFANLRIGGSGNERITAIAVDPVDQAVVVAGYYSSSNAEFDPNRTPGLMAPAPIGGNDIFVARYMWECTVFPCDGVLRLDWLYTTGTTGDDRALAVGVDVQGRAYATGYRDGGASGKQIWLAKIDEPPDGVRNTTTLSGWGNTIPSSTGFVWGGSGDDRGLGLSVDGLGRVLLTGQFAGTVDFNPIAGGDPKSSAGGLDLFVTRFAQTWDPGEAPFPIQYDGTFTIGAAYDEVGSAVAIEGLRSQRLAHAGWFGAPNSPNGYEVDFDLDPGTTCPTSPACRTGTGGADAFVSTLLPTIPAGVKTAVSLVLDTSNSVNDDPDYVTMMAVLRDRLKDPAVTPNDRTVAMNAILYDIGTGAPADCADQVVPWTVLSANNAWTFARRLKHQPRWTNPGCKNNIVAGLRAARDSQPGDRISACYRTILVVAEGQNFRNSEDAGGYLRTARDEVLDISDPLLDVEVHQINAIAVRGDDDVQPPIDTWRAFSDPLSNPPCPAVLGYLPSSASVWPGIDPGYLVKSDALVPQVPAQTWGLGLALHADGIDPPLGTAPPYVFEHPTFSVAVSLMLKRSTRCPGDYDRDGDVDFNDSILFMQDWNLRLPSADWNLDGGLSPTTCVINMDDVHTFNRAHALGCSCP